MGNLQNWPKNDSHRHWNEFYQQSDIEALAEVGISHIRIPYGYWLVDVAGKTLLLLKNNDKFSISVVRIEIVYIYLEVEIG